MYEEWKTRSFESNFNLKHDPIYLILISAILILFRKIVIFGVDNSGFVYAVNNSNNHTVTNRNRIKLHGSVFRFFIYSTLSIYGFLTLFSEDWIFTPFEYTLSWKYNLIPFSIKFYYYLEISYYFTSLCFLFVDPKMSDFYQMIIHHLITLMLICVSYNINILRYGVCVMLIHDVSDPLLELTKIFFYYNYQKKADILFSIFATVFIFTRCLVYPAVILFPLLYFKTYQYPLVGIKFGLAGLNILYILNLFWAIYIIRMVISFYREGRVNGDIRTDRKKEV